MVAFILDCARKKSLENKALRPHGVSNMAWITIGDVFSEINAIDNSPTFKRPGEPNTFGVQSAFFKFPTKPVDVASFQLVFSVSRPNIEVFAFGQLIEGADVTTKLKKEAMIKSVIVLE